MNVGDGKVQMLFTLFLQISQTFLLQKHAVINDADVIGEQSDLREDMAGDKDCFSAHGRKLPDKAAHLGDSDGVKPVDRLVENQKLRVVHHRKRNRQTLLHPEGIL